MHTFSSLSGTWPEVNNEGGSPNTGPVVSGNTVYVMTSAGGSAAVGTVFAVNVAGSGYSVLHVFQGSPDDGVVPQGPLTLSGNTLYGATYSGGTANVGVIFKLKTDGSGFTSLRSFAADTNGFGPQGPLIVAGNTMYGTTSRGGSGGGGTVFKISLPVPQLTITTSTTNLVLTWPTNFTSYVQSATNLNSPNWTANLPVPVIINGQFTVTNPVSGAQQFFRLAQ